ncbi:DUF3135 domain-containing protein [Rheinheimera sp. MM224]|uniref:DUF3135 domain-containing protein n=1 Tax=Rheinheimera sp. MM224 TaxID=3019969 RepID=UPI0021F85C06|nr:DUF3135 domain-containing protein [Rheinheimera sp. MM224]CAI3793785.1 hypothetical protein JAMGFMIE_00900 [Rheinheimera sp. MM224]
MAASTYSPLPAFDELLSMAKQDPAALDALQRKLNQELIDAQSDDKGRKAIQQTLFRLQSEQLRYKAPLVRLTRAYQLMLSEMSRMQDALEQLCTTQKPPQKPCATILPFRSKGQEQ